MTHEKRHSKVLYVSLVVVVVVATTVRVGPLVQGGNRLRYQCVSEDGYLMLTIARNIALGRGFSISDGTIPSNGTQPLAALLYALCFKCAGGDKLRGLYLVVGLQVATGIVTAMLLFVFTRKYLYKGSHSTVVAILSACLWYASPTSVSQSQNSLETGLCALLILSSIALYDAVVPHLRRSLNLLACLLLGVMLGITFLGRNDTCFLIAAMLAVHLLLGRHHHVFGRAFFQAFTIGATSVLVSLPWLWFNITQFGHPVPVSGRSEGLDVAFASNLMPAFTALLENLLLVLRIPSALQKSPYVAAISGMSLMCLVGIALWQRRWLAERFSAGIGIMTCFAGALFVYYTLFFGMPSFLGRYFFPAVMLCAVTGAAVATHLALWCLSRRNTAFAPAAVGLLSAFACVGLDVRIYIRGKEHLHSQVVDWVAENVPDDVWVGAVQTGTLGFYHDRTINLDGKVDPYAFAARQQNLISKYVIERNVEYIVDWVGIAVWAERPEFAVNYELLLKDPRRNLAVLRRK